MPSLKTRYLADYGNARRAAVALARDLMRGDPDTFKAGYSPANAALAAGELFGLNAAETDAVRLEVSRDA